MSDDPLVPASSILDTGLRLMRESFAAIPDGKRGAFVFYVERDGTVRAAVATKIGGHWTLTAEVEKRLHEQPSAFVGLGATW